MTAGFHAVKRVGRQNNLTLQSLFLFGIFCVSGPRLELLGEVTYVEIALLAFLLVAQRIGDHAGALESRIVLAFLLAAVMQFISDVMNDVVGFVTWKRVGTYCVLSAVFVSVLVVTKNRPREIKLVVAGFSVSLFVSFALGDLAGHDFTLAWRLGMSISATALLCLAMTAFPRVRVPLTIALLALATVHFIVGARAVGILTFIVAGLATAAKMRPRAFPARIRPGLYAIVFAGLILGIGGLYYGLKTGTEYEIFPEELQKKMEQQFSNPYGFVAAARPDTVAAIYAVSKRPLLGFGSAGSDFEVLSLFSSMAASSYLEGGTFGTVYGNALEEERLGIPSHSLLLSAWVDAGVLATPCWFIVFGLAFYVFMRSMLWSNENAVLWNFIAIMTMWDVLFSPGPNRLEMAVRIVVLLWAVRSLRHIDWLRYNAQLRLCEGAR
jgi:hypothetical protein